MANFKSQEIEMINQPQRRSFKRIKHAFASMMIAAGLTTVMILGYQGEKKTYYDKPKIVKTEEMCEINHGCLKLINVEKTKYPAKISHIEHIHHRGDSPINEKRVRELLENPFVSGYKDNGRATCSKYVRTTLDYLIGKDTSWYGVYGNAWDIPNHVRDAGGHIKFRDINPEELRAGDILFIRYKHSNFNRVAKRRLGEEKYFTHVALVLGRDENNEPVVTHLFHEKVEDKKVGIEIETYSELVNKISKEEKIFKVVGYARPDYNASKYTLVARKGFKLFR